jgi:hypothetical protein
LRESFVTTREVFIGRQSAGSIVSQRGFQNRVDGLRTKMLVTLTVAFYNRDCFFAFRMAIVTASSFFLANVDSLTLTNNFIFTLTGLTLRIDRPGPDDAHAPKPRDKANAIEAC